MSAQYKVMCVCECFISDKSIPLSFLSWCYRYLEKLKYQSQNSQNKSSGEKSNGIYETYKNAVMPHRRHISEKVYAMEKVKMRA